FLPPLGSRSADTHPKKILRPNSLNGSDFRSSLAILIRHLNGGFEHRVIEARLPMGAKASV
ncbi:MAG TPA: hypothetical protein V6D18_14435, partial [Thermosynechococcaceae cyanobacterium]